MDLRGGRCVRLYQGNWRKNSYGDHPGVASVGSWGQKCFVVDLDGASQPFETAPPSHMEGSCRSHSRWAAAFRDDVVNPELALPGSSWGRWRWSSPGLRNLVAEFGERIVVGIDARGGRLQ